MLFHAQGSPPICLDILMLKMYFVNGLKNMYEQLVAISSSLDVISSISNKIDLLTGFVDGYLSGANNLRLVSIILMILALILFLFLIIIIYVKTIVAFLKNEPRNEQTEKEEEDIFSEEDDEKLQEIMRNQERDMELEKELQKELDLARTQRDNLLQQQEVERQEVETKESLKKQTLEQELKAQKERTKQPENIGFSADEAASRGPRFSPQIDLDWKKGKSLSAPATQSVDNSTLSYHQSNKSLNELLGLIIDMLGRGVDDLKIAQTVMFRNQNINSEDDILQTIDAIKSFVELSRNQAFAKLPRDKPLPSEEDALMHLAHGDASLALALMEALMDNGIEKAAISTSEPRRDSLYKTVSDQACVFGTLASANDVMLATGAFELAIELSPNNPNAWSRVGDMYLRAQSQSKAIWAYQNAVNFADEEMNARELANAHKYLSQQLYEQGNSLQAAKLYNSSKQFYDSLGINRRLDKQEMEIIQIIESHHHDDIRTTIRNLLNNNARQTA